MEKDFFEKQNFSFNEMLSFINEDFYKNIRNKSQLMSFSRKLAEKYCIEKGITDVIITTANLAVNNFGNYNPCECEISISSTFTKSFNYFRDTNNFYYVKEFFETLLHELRHHEQNVSSCDGMHPIVKDTVLLTRKNNGFSLFSEYSYACQPIELDARYFTYKLFKDNKVLAPYYKSKEYKDEERAFENKQEFDYLSILKDTRLYKLKGVRKAIKSLTNSVHKIANKQRLTFVPGPVKYVSNSMTWSEIVNSVKLGEKVSASIAPDFYNDAFLDDCNSPEIESMVNEEIQIYNLIIIDIYNKRNIRRKENREAKIQQINTKENQTDEMAECSIDNELSQN